MKQFFLGLFVFWGAVHYVHAQSFVKASVGVAAVSQYDDDTFKIIIEGEAAKAIWDGMEITPVTPGEMASSVKNAKDIFCDMNWDGPYYTCILKNTFSIKTGEFQK